MKLPNFTDEGVLPVGDYELTFAELRSSHLVTGDGNSSPGWDTAWRGYLVGNLEVMVQHLWSIGIDRISINGSFVENKIHPNDIDGYFECAVLDFVTGQLERDLNTQDPYKIWTWALHSRRPDTNSTKWQLPMWHQYRVELYPHYPGLLTGTKDKFGNDLEFPAAFRKSRTHDRPKGIVRIIK